MPLPRVFRLMPVVALLLGASPAFAAPEPEPAVKSGVVTGAVAETGERAFTVVDAADKRWRFMPEWKGGKDGGPDKDILKAIHGLKKGDKVTVTWKFNEHYRALKIEPAKN